MNDATTSQSYIDRYVATMLVFAALTIGFLFFRYPNQPAAFFFIGWVSLCFVGTVALAANQPRIGAALLIIGSVPVPPIGLIGIWGGWRILQQVKEHGSNVTVGTALEEFYAITGTRLVGMGIAAVIAGTVLFSFHRNLGMFIAVGTAWILISFLQKKEPMVALYDEHLKVKKIPVSWPRSIAYSDILSAALIKNKQELVIRHKTADGEKSVSVHARVVGNDNLEHIAHALKEKSTANAKSANGQVSV